MTYERGSTPARSPYSPQRTPYTDVPFEYRVDRRYRVLKRSFMFPNDFHPRGTEMVRDRFVCNSIYAHHVRAGIAYRGPGVTVEHRAYPNEHFLLHLAGDLEWSAEGRTYRPAPGDEIFLPAFAPYVTTGRGEQGGCFLSCYLRVFDWAGLPADESPVDEALRSHRFQPAAKVAEATPIEAGEGWRAWAALDSTNTASERVVLDPGARIAPHHRLEEQIVMVAAGRVTWTIDDHQHVLGPEDMLFIPALTPFACENAGGAPAAFVRYRVRL